MSYKLANSLKILSSYNTILLVYCHQDNRMIATVAITVNLYLIKNSTNGVGNHALDILGQLTIHPGTHSANTKDVCNTC